eukprot:TRINITY_DN5039_c0_g1_i3.p1 TRINITY_DN5039_c0_g1~~TRINITY_DN5039_c0_g1_i3.p1  ORF type:complete len:458 (-),score=76.86 TRINITY_DN5039_c0_g1_i3:258-1631(-)
MDSRYPSPMFASQSKSLPGAAHKESVAVIGGGWYGCHIALKLAEQEGKSVVLFEAKDDLFKGASGSYGIRLHAGPHYPRSEVTRREVQATFLPIMQQYPNFFVHTSPAIYALGTKDVDGNPPRVQWPHFQQVCEECYDAKEINLNKEQYQNIVGAYSVFEPSLHMDKPREYFKMAPPKAGVQVILNHKVKQLQGEKGGVIVDGKNYDWAINCTYYQDFNPLSSIMGAQVCYQACCTLLYEEIGGGGVGEKSPPFSFTIMDGWFLCLMPFVKNDSQQVVLYHAKYTILDTFTNMQDCQLLLHNLSDEWIQHNVKPRMEQDALRFFPQFLKHYRYVGYNSGAATKIKNAHEFRSSLVWAQDRIINVFSGKVNNICEAAEEVKFLMQQEQDAKSLVSLQNNSDAVTIGDSVLRAEREIKNQEIDSTKDTCSLSKTKWQQDKYGSSWWWWWWNNLCQYFVC